MCQAHAHMSLMNHGRPARQQEVLACKSGWRSMAIHLDVGHAHHTHEGTSRSNTTGEQRVLCTTSLDHTDYTDACMCCISGELYDSSDWLAHLITRQQLGLACMRWP
jgi:hypothetical protein